jgi:HPt (histidine-containing phosphotransfer) domain-containing protein
MTAHMLKGSCANLGADQMAAWCRELESMARQEMIAEAGRLRAQLEHEFAAVRQILEVERVR